MILGEKIMREILWDLFKQTGQIKYFLLAKKIEESDKDDSEDRGREGLDS